MKKNQRLLHLLRESFWFDLGVSLLIVAGFATLGYLSREFAIDLHANFFA